MNELVTKLLSIGMPIYTIFDGALTTDIEARLRLYELQGRPLFREESKKDVLLAGPWLVPVVSRISLDRAMSASLEFGKSVFWVGNCEEEVLIRHLRILNAARMPDGRLVFFRHYDPDVLSFVVTLVDAGQAAQIFGPASMIGFFGGDKSEASVVRPDDLPVPESGAILFYKWQIDKLDLRQQQISRKDIYRMLKKTLFDEDRRYLIDRLQLDNVCSECVSYGMKNESSLARWSFLHFLTGGASNKEFIENLAESDDRDLKLRDHFVKVLKTSRFRKRTLEYFQ